MSLVFHVFSVFPPLNTTSGATLATLNLKGKESKCNTCFIETVLDKSDV